MKRAVPRGARRLGVIESPPSLVWCSEKKAKAIAFYLCCASAVIILGRLVREGWKRYCWEGRPARCPQPVGGASQMASRERQGSVGAASSPDNRLPQFGFQSVQKLIDVLSLDQHAWQ